MSIRDTTKTDPMFLLLGALDNRARGGRPGGDIEAMEAQGQRELVNDTALPTECPAADKAKLEAMGVKFGEPRKDDPVFCDATLPPGWEKRATSHSMWSDLVDDKGRKVASIFYKAAFYDRSAFMRLVRDEVA